MATLLAACGRSGSPAPGPPPPATTPSVVVLDCLGQPQVRPTSYTIACADGGNTVDQLHWSSWGPGTATASGTGTVNDCTPDCASGHDHSSPVTVTLTGPTPWPGHPDATQFSKLTVHYPGAHPANTPATEEYDLSEGRAPGR